MNGCVVIGLFGLVSSLRLLTLNHVYEKGKMSFIQNNHSLLKFGKPNNQNYGLFTTVVSKKRLFFYTDGIYYKFTIDSTGISLRLASTVASKIEFYTQEVAEESNIKVMKWDNLVKKRREELEKAHEEKDADVGEMKESKINSDNTSSLLYKNTVSRKKRKTEEDDEDVFNGRETSLRVKAKKDPFNDLLKLNQNSTHRIKKSYNSSKNQDAQRDVFDSLRIRDTKQESTMPEKLNRRQDTFSPNKTLNQDEIESDSDLDESKSLNIQIEVVDKEKKTFLLKNEANLCVTYFQKLFILAPCSGNDRQLFKLVKIENVLKNDDEKDGRNEMQNEILDEVASSSSESEKQAVSVMKKYKASSGKKTIQKSKSTKVLNKKKRGSRKTSKPDLSESSDKPKITAVDESKEEDSFRRYKGKTGVSAQRPKKKSFAALKEESNEGLQLHTINQQDADSSDMHITKSKKSHNLDPLPKELSSPEIKIEEEEAEQNKSKSLSGLLKRIENYDIKVPKIENDKQEPINNNSNPESTSKIETSTIQNVNTVSFKANQVYEPDVTKQMQFNNPYDQTQSRRDSNLEFYCKSILDSNQGRVDLLPSNCLKFANYFMSTGHKAPTVGSNLSAGNQYRLNASPNLMHQRQPIQTQPQPQPQPPAVPVKPKEEKKSKGNSSLLERLENNLFGTGGFN